MVLDDVENLNYDSLEAVARLRASERYKEIMQVGAPQVNSYASLRSPYLGYACQQWH